MSDEAHRALAQVELSKRINEASTSFTATLKTPLDPTEFDTSNAFEYTISDNSLDEGFVAISALIETLNTDYKDNNKVWGFSGRDKGLNLVIDGFSLDADSENPTTYTVLELLEMILDGSTITIGRGPALSKVITLTTDGEQPNRFCGTWGTKQEAINALFEQYKRFSGVKVFRWFVDFSGHFRWFELNAARGNKLYYFEGDPDILDFKPKKDITSVKNSFTGYYGAEEDQTSVTVTDSTSIAECGLRPGDTITETNYTEAEMTERLNWELDRKSKPIYTATIELAGVHIIEPGTQIEVPDNVTYADVEWTVVDWKLTAIPGKNTTSLGLSTDESAISMVNEYEAIQAIASKVVEDNKAMVGVVTTIPSESSSSDRCNVFIGMGGSGGVVVSARNVSNSFSNG